MDTPLAIRLDASPGDSLREQFANAARYGFEAGGLPGRSLSACRDGLLACRHELPLPISSISLGFRGSLISADPEAREQRMPCLVP